MVRQARSEATRRKIIDSAVALINEIGYPASGLADIIERAELTKGALYYHFESKEAVATAIIEEGTNTILGAFRSAGRSGSPAMENIVHGLFVVADAITADTVAQAACRLLRTFGGFNPAAKADLRRPRRRVRRARRRSRRTGRHPVRHRCRCRRRDGPGLDVRGRAGLERDDRRARSSAPLRAAPWRSCCLRSSPRNRSGTTASSLPASRCACRRRIRARQSPSDHSRSVTSWNVASATGSSPRRSADLLILARTTERSPWRNSTTRPPWACRTDSTDSSAGMV